MDIENIVNREVNLHTHTSLCRHASGTVEDYCREAVASGLKVLGISDHAPLPEGRRRASRMDLEQLADYAAMFADAREKYPELILLSGLEVDVDFDTPVDYFTEGMQKKYGFDYLAAGVHCVRDQNLEQIVISPKRRFEFEVFRKFIDDTVALMEWGVFDFINHPDIMLMSLDKWDSRIEKELARIPAAAERTGTPLEINAYGLRKPMEEYADGLRHQYPLLPFWEMAATYRITCVIGSDAHRPEDVFGNSGEAYEIAEKFHIPCVNAEVARKILRRKG